MSNEVLNNANRDDHNYNEDVRLIQLQDLDISNLILIKNPTNELAIGIVNHNNT